MRMHMGSSLNSGPFLWVLSFKVCRAILGYLKGTTRHLENCPYAGQPPDLLIRAREDPKP